MTDTDHQYLKDIESKEEGGTPAIVESIRAGLAVQVNIGKLYNTVIPMYNDHLGNHKNNGRC